MWCRRNCKLLLVNAFILTYVWVLFWWLVYPTPLRTAMLKPFASAVVFSGLWQGWGVFSPNVRKRSIILFARVTYTNGTSDIWLYPRLDHMDVTKRAVLERYRKFACDHINWEENSYLWPDFAKFVARLHSDDTRRVRSVDLYRMWKDLLPPERVLAGERMKFVSNRFYHYDARGVMQ